MKKLSIFICVLGLAACARSKSPPAAEKQVVVTYGFNPFGPLKYAHGHEYMAHVNSQAPKGGMLTYSSDRPVDSLQPYPWDLRNTSANRLPELRHLVLDSLMECTLDADGSCYGLVIDQISYPADRSYVEFHIRPEARFNNGEKITAADVIYSYQYESQSHPWFLQAFKHITGVRALDDSRVRFDIDCQAEMDTDLTIWNLGDIYVLNKKYSEANPPEKWNQRHPPLGSGPYEVAEFVPRDHIVLRRNPHYWAKDLPIRSGQYNFDTIKIQFHYFDLETRRMAFQRGDVDFWDEPELKRWPNMLANLKAEQASMEIPMPTRASFWGFLINSQKPALQDRRVRQALSLAFDFPGVNAGFYSHSLMPITSVFQGTPYEHASPISPRELEALTPFRDRISPEAFADNPGRILADPRERLLEAKRLLNEAGWKVNPKTLRLENGQGTAMKLEMPFKGHEIERLALVFAANLKRLGIELDLRRITDNPSYRMSLLQRNWDFFERGYSFHPGPTPEDLILDFGSEMSDDPGNTSSARIKNPVVDSLIQQLRFSKDGVARVGIAGALDRVLLSEHVLIPMGYDPLERLLYSRRLGHPAPLSPEGSQIVRTWWVR